MSKVYIVNRSIHDYSAAEKFGELVFLSEENMPKFSTSKAYRQFWEVLKDSKPTDHLLISGLPMLGIVAAFILTKKHGRLNLLLFNPSDGMKKDYIERIIMGEKNG